MCLIFNQFVCHLLLSNSSRLRALLFILLVLVLGFGQPRQPLVHLEQRLALARVQIGHVLLVAQEGVLLDHAQLVALAEPAQQHACEIEGKNG